MDPRCGKDEAATDRAGELHIAHEVCIGTAVVWPPRSVALA